jgi:hypothetical protein
MDYGMIGKIEKAKRYAEERDSRVRFISFSVTVQGENNPHTVTYQQNEWDCDCSFFKSRGCCSHTMAMERILADMIPESLNTEA